MATTFIAVQCFQCSTMQVKQQKKISNKWSCVVCNQKQSLRKVFAQSAMARDVRKFVQNFNMSRQLSDQNQSLSEEIIETFNSQSDGRKTKRNDWSEYVDDQEEYGRKFDKDEGDNGLELEPMVVTEIPKALFKKPKPKDYYSSNGFGPEKMLKPTFPDRRNAKRQQNEYSQDVQLNEFEQISCKRASKKSDYSNEEHMSLPPSVRAAAPKWNRFKAQIQDNNSISANSTEKQPFVRQPTKRIDGRLNISKWSDYITQEDETNNASGAPMAAPARSHHTTAAKGPVSKWSSFIIEEVEEDNDDDDSLETRRRRDSWGDCVGQRITSYPLEKLMNDERVEDDIHPDFL